MMIVILFACGTPTAERPVLKDPAPIAENVENTHNTLVQLLSVHDGFSCARIKQHNPVLTDLSRIVEEVNKPAWVPMRAVACMIEIYPEESQPDLEKWIIDANRKGLAFLIAGQVEKLPDRVALSVVKKGLQGPHAIDIRSRLEKLDDPRLQSILYPSED